MDKVKRRNLIAGNVFSHQRELGEQKRERKTKGRKN
jgi:hypothetical protein